MPYIILQTAMEVFLIYFIVLNGMSSLRHPFTIEFYIRTIPSDSHIVHVQLGWHIISSSSTA